MRELRQKALQFTRTIRTFMQADFHARQKIAHKNVQVNCKQKAGQPVGYRCCPANVRKISPRGFI